MTPPIVVSHTLKIGFVTIPKTASTSIVAALMAADGADVRNMTAEQVDAAKQNVPAPAGYAIYAVVRNPYDRLVSVWQNKVHKPHKPQTILLRMGFREGMSFPDFVRMVRAKGTGCNPHLYPQHDFLSGTDAALLRYERLAAEWLALMAEHPGLPELPCMNASAHKSYREYYDAETQEIVGSMYARDLTRLGYAF